MHSNSTVVTDHRALVWLQSAKHTGRLERWALQLQEYNFKIKHRPGKSNSVAEALSRRVYDEQVSASLNPQENSVAFQMNVEPITPQDHQTETKETRSEYIQVTLGYIM